MSETAGIYRADYIDRLPPETTIGIVFGDLFARGQALAQQLEERPSITVSSSLNRIPIDLMVGHAGYHEPEFEEDGREDIAGSTTHISAGRTPIWSSVRDSRNLLQLTHEGKAGEDISPNDVPIDVTAFRNDPSMYAAYFMRRCDEEILVGINELPVLVESAEEHEHLYVHEQPYIGTSVEDADTTVQQLEEEDKWRLRIVTNAIELGIVRTELLAQGADFHAMFGIKPPEKSPRFKHLSLGRLSLSWG